MTLNTRVIYIYIYIILTDALGKLILLSSAVLTLTIATPVSDILHMSYVESGKLLVADESEEELFQVDTDGTIIETVNFPGPYCVTEDGALLYMSDDEDEDEDEYGHVYYIKKKTSLRTVTLLKIENSGNVVGIHSSRINGHILVLLHYLKKRLMQESNIFYEIERYDVNGVKIQDIKIDETGQFWFWGWSRFTENRNGDIIISDSRWEAVLGMDGSGRRRFKYSHTEDGIPMDICTDKYGHVLVAFKSSIHLLDEDGKFQKILLRNMSSYDFESVCLDDKQNLYVGCEHGIVKVYKYLKND